MTAVQKQFGTLFLLVSVAVGQSTTAGTATVQDVKVVRDGSSVRIEVELSAPVNASVVTASHPDRLVLELPNTLSGARQRHIPVNYNGVRAVRMGLNSADPPITRLVLDLDRMAPYALKSNGAVITLTVSAVNAHSSVRRNTPAAAESGGLIGVFRREPKAPPPVATSDSTPLPAPPPSQPPIAFPQDEPANSGTPTAASASSSRPTATHPNYGSLQQGTVFPSLGSPGADKVPPVNGASHAGFDAASAGPPQTGSPAAQANSGFSGPASATVTPAQTAVATAPQPKTESASAQPQPAPAVVIAPVPALAAPVSQTTPSAADNSQAAAVPPSVTSNQPAPQGASGSTAVHPTTALVPPSPPSLPTQGSTEQGAVTSAPEPAPVETAEATPATPETPAGATGETGEAEQPVLLLRAADPNLRTVFKVKYVAEGVAYLDGGRSSGLTEGMKLEIKDTDLPAQQGTSVDPSDPHVVAELEITGVAETSAVTDIHTPKRPVKPGDLAYLSSGDAAALVQQRALSTTRKYPAVVTFTEGDPLEEEARAEVPKPPLPSVNRARGRIGFDYMGTVSHGSSAITNSDLGLVLRADITRINGTYWNLSGYWRGRLNSTSGGSQQTLQDLINRTYHLSMTYDNPNSAWVAGFGRLYLPWAPSLDTIDGGYFGRRLKQGVTSGIFAGSTPDPTSWSYNPNQEIGGAFINFEGGSFDAFHYSSTSGLGVSFLNSQINRPFVFFENSLSYKRTLSIYDSLQADSPKGNSQVPAPGPGLSRNFFTMRVQVTPRVELDFNHNYFRDIPTFNPTLVPTGLLDKYLFQGFSAGARVEVVKHIWLYTDLGLSSRTGDAKNSLNQMYGVTFDRLPWFGLRADAHYSRFNSSFGDGSYKSLSLSRNLTESLRLELLAGQQDFTSPLTSNTRSRFLNANVETTFGAHYFMQGGFTLNRGSLSYDQWSFTVGYRFDSKGKSK